MMVVESMSGIELVWRSALALTLVLLNGFFVAAEFALVSARRARIEALARSGNFRARLALNAITHINLTISATQVGITLASLALGWVGESTVAAILLAVFHSLPSPINLIASHTVAAAIGFIIITFMHIVLGELVPKSIGLLNPEAVVLWTVPPLAVVARICKPFIWLLTTSANVILRLFGLRSVLDMERVHRPEEIELLVTQSYEHGLIREDPVEMIRGVFHLSEIRASEIMTPRTDMIAIPIEMTVQQAVDLILEEEHSRYAVYDGSIDHVIGVAIAREVWRAQREGRTDLRSVMREPLFVPDSKSVEALLREMQQEGEHMAIVVDEFGGTAGMVTIEDVLEEIVGEIEDETDVESSGIVVMPDGRIHLHGSVTISEVNERFGLSLPEDDYTTIAGFVLGRLGRVPRVGDEIKARGGSLKVTAMHRRRIDKLIMKLPTEDAEETSLDEMGGGMRDDVADAPQDGHDT
jgi:CBS domain containing-hemolysin-like protein